MAQMKFNKPKRKGWKNARAVGRKTRFPSATVRDRGVLPPPEPLPDGAYFAANCVVLAAAIFSEPWAKQWAEDLLPSARQVDARRLA